MDHEVRVKLERATGDKLTPEGVELGDLFAILGGLRAAILLNAGLEVDQPPAGVNLVRLETSSVVPVLRPATSLEDSTNQVLDAIERRDPSRLKHKAAQAAHKAFEHARELRWVVHIGGRGRSIVIDELRPFPAPDGPAERPAVKGTTTLYGTCVSAGGQRKTRAKIALSDGSGTLDLRVSREHARQLGERLYDLVGVYGEASWDPANWRIIDFAIIEVLDYTPKPVRQAFHALREAVGDTFDSDEAIERMRALRSEE
jgi:hypothetical protein